MKNYRILNEHSNADKNDALDFCMLHVIIFNFQIGHGEFFRVNSFFQSHVPKPIRRGAMSMPIISPLTQFNLIERHFIRVAKAIYKTMVGQFLKH